MKKKIALYSTVTSAVPQFAWCDIKCTESVTSAHTLCPHTHTPAINKSAEVKQVNMLK